MKKAIVNITTGLLEKEQNKKELSKLFDNYDEANYYSIKYNGRVLPIVKTLFMKQKEKLMSLGGGSYKI
jgi:type II secretory pathway component GspD/PulD (secretin)